MEENVISMFMDVKLDIRERKLEFSHLKSWTRYFVRVEAIKCFPCYIKISFFKNYIDESTDLIVRINIPGLTVQMAKSRTRAHSYGLFWKNNRKRCCAYFALPSQLLCERHLYWMKKSIRNLELYRQEILQLRRASRTPIHEIRQEMQPTPFSDDLGVYQNLDFTQNMCTVHDILGPLPKLPQNSEVNLSRRISAASGIYEEIFDPTKSSGILNSGPRMSRASIASGIYEEMKLPDIQEYNDKNTKELTEDTDTAPPLPPRPRADTNEFDLQRSFTTPESEYSKKKRSWQLLESMFRRRRTQSNGANPNSESSNKGNQAFVLTMQMDTPLESETVVYRDNIARIKLSENKRNSFSSPDLSKLKLDIKSTTNDGSIDNLSDGGSCSSEFFVQQIDIEDDCFVSSESQSIINKSSIEESLANLFIASTGNEEEFANVSVQLTPNFNNSCNSSTVNLVGSNCNLSQKNSPETNLDGYCEMGPAGTGFNREKMINIKLRSKEELDQKSEPNTESIYMNMDCPRTSAEETSRSSSSSSGVSSMTSNRSSACSSGRHRNSIDDKISSYYPNVDFVSRSDSPKVKEIANKQSNVTRVTNRKLIHNLSKSAQKPSSIKIKHYNRSVSSDRYELSRPAAINDSTPLNKNSENNPPEVATVKKYATIARTTAPSSSKYQEKNIAKKSTDQLPVSSGKRFGSLPRFAKIDLSPLRLKINSVLQRHNSENL